jgi:hypothetical protein
MSTIDRIRQRLLRVHGIDLPADTELRRTHAGRAMKSQGAWSWSLFSPSNARDANYGSHYPATDLLKCRNWEIELDNYTSPDKSIDPCVSCQHEGLGACKKGST